MAIIQRVSGYDAILAQRQRRADAAAVAEARSAARQQAASTTLAKSDGLRNAMANNINQTVSNQVQMTSQLVSTRVNAANKVKAEALMAKADAALTKFA
ncbi:MAG: hypothetical protein KKF33_18635 [Alphaproteobacteria bacterium]|jgi:hypothetical protein|nr:hypothetical protein [Alphaproteobacteria bacterium]